MRRSHKMPFGPRTLRNGVEFRVWAPSAPKVRLWTPQGEFDMEEAEGGWHRHILQGAAAGQRYRFRVGEDLLVPDPASRFQPEDVEGPSLVVDPEAYAWADGEWKGRAWEEAVIYEAHMGSVTPEGTFAAFSDKLELLRDLGFTAIELMPLADFPGKRNWGYDGVLHYAPDHAYGTPDDLKALVDRAHGLGLMMILDVVYNHFGPSGNYLPAYAGAFFTDRHQTLWGAGINYDGPGAETVRDFFVHNALYWLEEYHFDGLRFDAVHAIADDSSRHFIAELAERIRSASGQRQVHLILENADNGARWLGRAGEVPSLHTAQWADDVHHAWHRLLTDEDDGYYADYGDPIGHLGRCLAEGFAYQGEMSTHEGKPRGEPSTHLPPSAFVAFLQNHDQIGNRAFGERLSHLADPSKLALARACLLLSPQIPLLFMGEEWAASTPFQYFVDFPDEELSKAVREGRRREFGSFGRFKDEAAQERIPDPTASDTLLVSSLDWSEASRPPHSEVLAQTHDLLRIRRETVVPLTKSTFRGARWSRPTPDVLEVTWRFAGGSLRFIANFGSESFTYGVAQDEHPIWPDENAHNPRSSRLMPWTGVMLARLS
ncbi:malto-oligosyltrehalose trehalohydrolase [Bosea beijingensis]|uniref:malto-oligosyltrehalose trehalohydrolase n=1 Tax=Bosea beijingensis TaxID=3068632 RepID=UPI00274209DF|nr:malto-oligosyltrehalose trehalohydrolase [Bosea sp. REN20]